MKSSRDTADAASTKPDVMLKLIETDDARRVQQHSPAVPQEIAIKREVRMTPWGSRMKDDRGRAGGRSEDPWGASMLRDCTLTIFTALRWRSNAVDSNASQVFLQDATLRNAKRCKEKNYWAGDVPTTTRSHPTTAVLGSSIRGCLYAIHEQVTTSTPPLKAILAEGA